MSRLALVDLQLHEAFLHQHALGGLNPKRCVLAELEVECLIPFLSMELQLGEHTSNEESFLLCLVLLD
jgi:hypothetical protein